MNYFDDPNSKHFSFESFAEGMAEDTFGVINFKGYEAISKTYDFEIMLVSSKKDIDLEDILQSQAVFTIHRGEDDDVLYNGILSEFDQLHEVNDIIFYRARLVPKLWWLTLTHHNQVFLNQSVPDFVEDALRDGGLETEGFDIATLSGYQELDYICQYDESHFNFVSRSLERQGIYYYFTQESDGEVLVLTDTKFSHDALKEGAELFYNPASGLEGKHLGEAIGVFTCRQKQLPTEIILKDYNYERPSLDITSRADVDTGGRGISYIYGEYFATPEEGERLANIRAEELLCQKQEFFGESTVPYIMPGFTFKMNNHYREDFNQEYLILEVTHEGNQSHLMSAGIATDPGKSQNQAIYHNSFKAIPNDVQYRPERITEKPKISGTIHAKIDSEVDSEYAQIDEQGRYRVRLPFDINDEHMDGKGSAPIRMMQSYAGKNRGMQFPLVKGTEVLLTFIEGNPDRPIIAGAVSNPETQGPVNADNQSESVIQTGGNNKIRMEDKAGSERIILDSPAANSWIRVGAHNDPITLNGEATTYVEKGDSTWSDPGAIKTSNEAITTLTGSFLNRSATTTLDQSPVIPVITHSSGRVLADDAEVVASAGIYQYTYTDVNDKAIRTVVVYEPGEEIHSTVIPDANGIRIRSAGDLWLEAQSRFGDYHVGKPIIVPSKVPSGGTDPGDHVPKQIGDLLDQFGHDQAGAAKGYSPTGLLKYLKDASGQPLTTNMNDAFAQGHVRVSSLDTFNTQEGNIYDFGGYWNYNLGNSYAENHIDQAAILNKDRSAPKAEIVPDSLAGIGGVGVGSVGSVISTILPAIPAGIMVHKGGGGAVATAVIAGAIPVVAGIVASIATTISTMVVNYSDQSKTFGDIVTAPDTGKIETWAKDVTLDTGDTWVDRSYGDSYDYKEGHAIEITHGNKEEHVKGDVYEYKYGGKREATSFTGDGLKTHWESSSKGQKHEASWDRVTGQLVGYEYSHSGHFKFSVALPTLPKVAVEVALSSINAKFSLSAGTDINVTAAAAMSIKADLSAGFSAVFESKFGGEVKRNDITGKMTFSAFDLEASQEAALEAKKQTMLIKKISTSIAKVQMAAVDASIKTENIKMGTSIGQKIYM